MNLKVLFVLFSLPIICFAQKPDPDKDTTTSVKPTTPSVTVGNIKPNVVPQGPEVYSLGKYGNVPVSMYTGVPNISLPISSINDKDIAVDIKLSYHSAGNKVDEISSWCGLGWTLQAGGVITRVINHRAEIPLSGNIVSPPRSYIDIYRSPTTVDDYIVSSQLQATANGGYDAQPDEYIFNFMGKAGKFHLDSTGAAVLYNHEGLQVKFEYLGASLSRFVILGTDGMRYEFEELEGQTNVNSGQAAITSWYISKIVSPGGGKVTFEYQGFPSLDIELRTTENVVEIIGNPQIFALQQTPEARSTVSEKKIRRIITSNGYIEFVPSIVKRQDIRQDTYALSDINFYATSGMLLKRFKLYTGYFEADNSRKYSGPDAPTYNYLNYRLRLDSLQVFDAQNKVKHRPYKLTYLGDNDPAILDNYTLPARFSNYQDHWGYFNAKTNAHLFPGNPLGEAIGMDKTYEMFGSPSSGMGTAVYQSFVNGADRSVDTSAVKAGMLRQIVYPTGGHSIFTFESNVFGGNEFGCGLRIKQIDDYAAGQPTVRKLYSYQAGVITRHPKDFYYKYYPVEYIAATTSPGFHNFLPTGLIEAFGLPVVPGAQGTVRNYVKILAFPQNLLGSSSQIGYGTVIVTEPGIGRTENHFETAASFPDYVGSDDSYDNIDFLKIPYQFQAQYVHSSGIQAPVPQTSLVGIGAADFPYPPVYSNEWKRGVLISQTVYNQNNIAVKVTTNQYERRLLNTIKGWKVISFSNGTQFIAVRYFVPQGWLFQSKQAVTEYDLSGQNGVTAVQDFYYDNPVHAMITRHHVSRSDGNIRQLEYKYPHDYQAVNGKAPFVDKMINANMVYPIEQITRLKKSATTIVTDASVTSYKTYTGANTELIKPFMKFSFSGLNGSISSFIPYSGTNDAAASTSYRETLRYTQYDALGNPLGLLVNGIEKLSYLWSYKGQYPVAEIRNASSSEVLSAMGGTTFEQMAAMTDSPTIQSKLNSVRSSLHDATMTTYLYAPLIGITDKTDPAGKNLKYEYDTFDRLEYIKDNSGSIRTSYCYNYAGQKVNCTNISVSGVVHPNYLSLITFYSPPLPVKLVSFRAVKLEQTGLLTWTTTEELNSKVFEIERSQDGKKWVRIGSVESHGDSKKTQYYSFIDGSPLHAENLYRLKMIDHATSEPGQNQQDESFSYSGIESLKFDIGARLYPNPLTVGEKLTLETYTDIISIKIYNVQGKVVFGQNRPERQIDLHSLQSGVYVVQLTAANGLVTTHRIVKQ